MAPPVPSYLEHAGIFIFVAAGLALVVSVVTRMPAMFSIASPAPRATIGYNPSKICAGADNKNLDFSEVKGNRFTINLTTGCFGGWVRFPKWWKEWHANAESDAAGYWVYYLTSGYPHPQGPYYANEQRPLIIDPRQPFRLQGNGTIVFYTNQTLNPSAAPPADASNLPDVHKALSRLSVRNDRDPQYCEKPQEAYYAAISLNFGAPGSPYGVGNPPVFLFSSLHDSDTINWANGFKGTVPVCVLVDEKGNPTNIRFPQPPGHDIEEHIKEQIAAWHFKAGNIDYSQDEKRAVPCQLAYEFLFSN